MGMGIQSFYNRAVERDFSRDFSMRVENIAGVLNKDDNLYIRSASLPSYQVTNHQVPFMGVNFNVPGAGTFPGSDSWTVSFISDQALTVRSKILQWQSRIFHSWPTGVQPGQGAGGPASLGTNSVGFYSLPGRNVTALVHVLDQMGNAVRSIKLVGIYPVTVGEISYDMTGTGTPVNFDVTLAYQWWEPVTSVNRKIIG